jgi:glycosyltransferase involved in cell wall biosynthesis
MKVIITVPAYNEEGTIGQVVRDIKRVMDETKYSYAVIVVDDGSTDRTAETAHKAGAKVYRHPRNLGLAEAFRTEVQKCLERKADIIVHTDADGQYLATDIPKLLKEIENGYDLVLGSRFKGKIESMPLTKRLGNRAFSKVLSQITGIKISDGQTGFRAFTKEVAEKISLTSMHTYTQEQIIRAAKQKFRIKEVPIYFARRHDKSRLMRSPFHYAIRAWIQILRIYRDYQPLKFFGMFGGMFFAAGFILGLWIVYLLLTTGSVQGLPKVVLSVLFLSIGVQIILFGFLADMIRKEER